MTHHRSSSLFLIALLLLSSLGLTVAGGCSRSEAEREIDEAGDTVRDAAEETKDFMRDTADGIRDAAN